MTELEIRKHLKTSTFGRQLYCFDQIDSTNSSAKSLAAQGIEEGAIVIAEEQRTGRGRFDRTWHSSPGLNLTFSIILRPNIHPRKIGVLSLYAGLAVTQGVMETSGLDATCKWPNDILVNRKKICGILCE